MMPHRRETAKLTPGAIAQLACILEVAAPKPGNVHPGKGFIGTTWLDFVVAAAAIAPVLDRAAVRPLGDTILAAVRATRELTGQNVNLGIILLLSPLAAAPVDAPPQSGVGRTLANVTPDDARKVYEAIRLAAPGGLGTVPESDVHDDAPSDLREAMALAADRDLIARQYATDFRDVFEVALPELETALGRGLSREDAVVRLHVALMARYPDSLIRRKCGHETALEAARRAQRVVDAGWPGRGDGLLRELDDWLRADGHRRNPGTTADLVAAALFLAIRAGIISLPL